MSNSGVNTCFAKCFILFMAIVILLQGSAYLGLSIWGIALRQCSKEARDLSSKLFQFTMNLIYFLDKDCGSPSIRLPDVTDGITLDVDFNKGESIATRDFIFFIAYAVISSLWIIASLAIITTLGNSITKTVYALCFWPWFFIVMAGSILDVIATGFHIHDVMNTTSVAKTFKYLGISANEETVQILSNFEAYFITPAIIMTCISSRVILIWLLNIFGSSFCLSLSKTLSKRSSTKNNTVCDIIQQDVLSVQTQQYVEQPRRTERSMPILTVQSLKEQPTSSSQSNERSTSIQSSSLHSTSALHNDNKKNNNDSIIENHSDPLQRNIFQYQEQLSPISPLNNRYSINYKNFQYPMKNQRVSEELRGQLPWSYTSFPPPIEKKPQMQVCPQIPPPDYGY